MRRHRRIPRDAVIARDPPERQRAELCGTTTVPPVESVASVDATSPCTWNSGITHSDTSSGDERVAARDVAGGDRQVGVRQRHALRPAGAAAGVQDERDIVQERAARPVCGRLAPDSVTVPVGVHVDGQDRDAIAGGAARIVGALGRKEQDARVGVFEVEPELVFLVAGVQRRGGAGHRRRQKRDDVRQAVGQAPCRPGRRA